MARISGFGVALGVACLAGCGSGTATSASEASDNAGSAAAARRLFLPLYEESLVIPRPVLPARVENEIKRCDCVIGFLTAGGTASAYVNQELTVAMTAKKPVIPVLEKGADLTGFRVGLDYIELDRNAPQDCATKLSARLAKLPASDEVRSAICWAIIGTAGLLFLGRTEGELKP